MRSGPLLLPLLLLCAGCSGGTDENRAGKGDEASARSVSELKPPVIVEGFTRFPCPAKPATTIELMACAEQRILESDKAINEVAAVIFSQLSRSARARFVRGEHAWLTYRRAVCQSRADVYEGGSLAKVVSAQCVAKENLAHLKDLRAFKLGLPPDDWLEERRS